MELHDYLRILWRRGFLVALAVLVAAGSALVFSTRATKRYQARAKVFIGPRSVGPGDLSAAMEELTFSREFIASYAELLKSRALAERVVQKEGLALDPTTLAAETTTRIVPDTRIIEVSVTDTDPARAQRVTNSLVETFISEGVEQFGGRAGVRVSVLEPALRQDKPVSPKPVRDGVFGAVLGLALGTGMAFLLEQLDTTVRRREDVEAALGSLPVLATIPRASVRRNRQRQFLFDEHANAGAAEAFRTLRTNLQFLGVDQPIRRVLVISPVPKDGKTTVAANLAASFAIAGVKTVLVDCDLRQPASHLYFDVKALPGITDVLLGRSNLEEALRSNRIPNLSLLPSGTLPPNPSELLGSQRMTSVLDQVGVLADVVVIDSPPALAVADALVLAALVDGVIMVVRSGQTHRQRAQEMKAAIERLGVRLLGIVINDVDAGEGYYAQYHYNYGSKKPRRDEDPAAPGEWLFPAPEKPGSPQPVLAAKAGVASDEDPFLASEEAHPRASDPWIGLAENSRRPVKPDSPPTDTA